MLLFLRGFFYLNIATKLLRESLGHLKIISYITIVIKIKQLNQKAMKKKINTLTIHKDTDYKYSSYYNNSICTRSTKEISILWNEDLECGVRYHKSIKTDKICYIELQIGLDSNKFPAVRIKLPNTTSIEDAIDTLNRLYTRMYSQIKNIK